MVMIAPRQAARSVRDISHLFLSCPAPAAAPPTPPLLALTALDSAPRKSDGRIIVDQDRIIRQINPMARQFLNLPQEEPVGQVFDLYVTPETIQNISIKRHNGQPGIGRMTVSSSAGATAHLLYIFIQDITAP